MSGWEARYSRIVAHHLAAGHLQYPNEPLIAALRDTLGELAMGDLSPFNVVIAIRDVKENRSRFVKPGRMNTKT